jgi:hypothetical protein
MCGLILRQPGLIGAGYKVTEGLLSDCGQQRPGHISLHDINLHASQKEEVRQGIYGAARCAEMAKP